MDSWHLTFSTRGRVVLFADEARRRSAVRAIFAVVGDHLLLFCIVDDHVHVVVHGDRQRAGRLAQALLLSLRALGAPALQAAHLRPVENRRHLQWLVRYCIDQPRKHGLQQHGRDQRPALWTGSCFLDLVGARHIEGGALHIDRALPRLRLATVMEQAGLPGEPVRPADDALLGGVGPARLREAASAALAVDPALTGRSAPVVAARRVTAQLAQAAGFPVSLLATTLGLSHQAAGRLRRAPVDPAAVRATRVRLALEALTATGPRLVAEPLPPWSTDHPDVEPPG